MSETKRKNLPADQRRNQLLDCAQQLFATKGYDATTIADVMASAQVSKGGFYHHFESKEALMVALAQRMAETALISIAPLVDDPDLDPFARLNAILLRLRMQKTEIEPELTRAFEAVFQPANIMLFDRIRRAIGAIMAPVLSRVIAEGVADGTFSTPDPAACAELILHLNAAAYDTMSAAIAERDAGRPGPARQRLHAMMAMQAIAIDRLLGLPDGSITWIEPERLDQLLGMA